MRSANAIARSTAIRSSLQLVVGLQPLTAAITGVPGDPRDASRSVRRNAVTAGSLESPSLPVGAAFAGSSSRAPPCALRLPPRPPIGWRLGGWGGRRRGFPDQEHDVLPPVLGGRALQPVEP